MRAPLNVSTWLQRFFSFATFSLCLIFLQLPESSASASLGWTVVASSLHLDMAKVSSFLKWSTVTQTVEFRAELPFQALLNPSTELVL